MSILSILPSAMRMESKWPAGTWTPVTRCLLDISCQSRQGAATPPTQLPSPPTGRRHTPHNRTPAADTIQMVHSPQVRQTLGSRMLTRHPLRTIRMTKTDFTAIAMPCRVATLNCLALVISISISLKQETIGLGCLSTFWVIKSVNRGNHRTSPGRLLEIFTLYGLPQAAVAEEVSQPQVHQTMSLMRQIRPICTRYSLLHPSWRPLEPMRLLLPLWLFPPANIRPCRHQAHSLQGPDWVLLGRLRLTSMEVRVGPILLSALSTS